MSKGSVWPVIDKWIAKGNFPRLARSGRLRGYFLSMVIIVTLTCRLAVAGTLVNPWAVLAQFSADYVRSFAVFQNKLYIGLRDNGGLWTYDGAKFVNIGAPPGLTLQVKTLVPSVDGTLLYVGGVPAYIYTWNGSSYTLSLNATTTDSEIYKGTVYDGDIFFPTTQSKTIFSQAISIDLTMAPGRWSTRHRLAKRSFRSSILPRIHLRGWGRLSP